MADPDDIQPIDFAPGPTWNTEANQNPELSIVPSGEEVGAAALNQAVASGPTATLGRIINRNLDSPSPVLTGDEANAKYGVQGPTEDTTLKWFSGDTVREDVAQQQQSLMQQRISNQWITSHRPSTWGSAIMSVGGDLVGTAVDPANIAASFVPVSWLGRGAELGLAAARMGDAAADAARLTASVESTLAGRIGAAAVQNATGVALTQPILLAGAQQDHADYTFGTAASNILFGGLLGAGIHGLGEILTPDIARGMMRSGAKSVDDGTGMHPQLAEDYVAAARPRVMQDLQEQLGRAPNEDEITSEMQTRQDQISQNALDGKYQPQVPPVGSVEPEVDTDVESTSARINEALRNDDYAGAADALKQHTDSLEANPDLNLSDEDKATANQPVENFTTTKSLVDDFVSCVATA